MGSSIRWTLIGWYGLLLAGVLAVFGGVLYARAVAATLDAVDAVLGDQAGAIAGALEWDEHDGWELELSDDYLRGLGADAYYRVWAADGTLLRQGGAAGAAEPDPAAGPRPHGDRREVQLPGPLGTRVLVGRSIAGERAGLAGLLAVVVVSGLAVLALGLCGLSLIHI